MFGEDAWMQCGDDPFGFGYGDDEPWGYYGSGRRKKQKEVFIPDPLHYHTFVQFNFIKKKTFKAYLFIIDGYEVWLPKSWVRELDSGSGSCYVWKEGYNNKMDEVIAKCKTPLNVRHVRA